VWTVPGLTFLLPIMRATTGLETVTRGVVLATSHRVISPGAGSPARYSIPFFQIISQGIHLEKKIMDCTLTNIGVLVTNR
jgi:hypothetical protein